MDQFRSIWNDCGLCMYVNVCLKYMKTNEYVLVYILNRFFLLLLLLLQLKFTLERLHPNPNQIKRPNKPRDRSDRSLYS